MREPPLPGGVVELGLRTAPSFEALAATKPDLILINALNTPMRARLERIAPVYANTIFSGGQDPVERAVATARELGARLDRVAGAGALVSHVTDVFAAARVRLAGVSVRPVVPLGFIDARHARICGAGSLFEGVMARVGLCLGWTKPTNAWGFSVAAVEALAACRDADLLVIEPVPTDARRLLDAPGLWSSLIAANGARVTTMPPIWAFGDITAAARCAALLADAFSPPTTPPMVEARSHHAATLALAIYALATVMALSRLAGQLPPSVWMNAARHPAGAEAAQLVFHFATLPRVAVAALCGAGLAASGAIVQHVLGNPLASPVTLGVSSGAQLALVVATLFAPETLGAAPDVVGLLGGIASMGVVFAVAARQRFSMSGLILSGLCVGLFCGALGALLKLFNQE